MTTIVGGAAGAGARSRRGQDAARGESRCLVDHPGLLVLHVLVEVSSARTKSGHRGRTSRWSWPHTAANRDLRLPDRMTDAYTS